MVVRVLLEGCATVGQDQSSSAEAGPLHMLESVVEECQGNDIVGTALVEPNLFPNTDQQAIKDAIWDRKRYEVFSYTKPDTLGQPTR